MSVFAILVLNVIPYMISFKYNFFLGGGAWREFNKYDQALYLAVKSIQANYSYFKYIMKYVDIENTFTSFCIKNNVKFTCKEIKNLRIWWHAHVCLLCLSHFSIKYVNKQDKYVDDMQYR